MNIGLDYDDTYTADPKMWDLFVHLAKDRGHDVRIVTFRFESPNGYSNEDVVHTSEKLGIPVIFCNGVQKDKVTIDLGFVVDVWIDDFPVGIPLGEHLVGMAQGIRINDDRKRTQLTNSTNNAEEKESQYSSTPLQIGHHDG